MHDRGQAGHGEEQGRRGGGGVVVATHAGEGKGDAATLTPARRRRRRTPARFPAVQGLRAETRHDGGAAPERRAATARPTRSGYIRPRHASWRSATSRRAPSAPGTAWATAREQLTRAASRAQRHGHVLRERRGRRPRPRRGAAPAGGGARKVHADPDAGGAKRAVQEHLARADAAVAAFAVTGATRSAAVEMPHTHQPKDAIVVEGPGARWARPGRGPLSSTLKPA